MFLTVTLVDGENEDAVYLWTADSQEHISSATNTIILIMHFPFFKYNTSIFGYYIVYIVPLYNCMFLH